ncbi:uncharacterized protein A1O5_08408 [Cladophialophora psammophila CBS 110553]|uniref:Uncharacterized protein n=1 Tax=Cladophialophora psammophila CBS 110553 TaxID=1182543 RepID=W9XDV8_9EURO|nr:uncharacterized protein A1O5_08408 [Cladophialophora psammophila CBS 110553]EXJ68614.1 hypothetical protein A1O5_08408 [Cladophialophora psammophila CBS 110553]
MDQRMQNLSQRVLRAKTKLYAYPIAPCGAQGFPICQAQYLIWERTPSVCRAFLLLGKRSFLHDYDSFNEKAYRWHRYLGLTSDFPRCRPCGSTARNSIPLDG